MRSHTIAYGFPESPRTQCDQSCAKFAKLADFEEYLLIKRQCSSTVNKPKSYCYEPFRHTARTYRNNTHSFECISVKKIVFRAYLAEDWASDPVQRALVPLEPVRDEEAEDEGEAEDEQVAGGVEVDELRFDTKKSAR